METEDILAIGVVGLIVWLLMRAKTAPAAAGALNPDGTPVEVVTSTISYGGI